MSEESGVPGCQCHGPASQTVSKRRNVTWEPTCDVHMHWHRGRGRWSSLWCVASPWSNTRGQDEHALAVWKFAMLSPTEPCIRPCRARTGSRRQSEVRAG